MKLVLVGDSDIALWPKEAYPIAPQPGENGGSVAATEILVFGRSGASLSDITGLWQSNALPALRNSSSNKGTTTDELILVVCGGENDVGMGLSLDVTVAAMEGFLQEVFQGLASTSVKLLGLIFLGPKFEPWQHDDPASKKKYSKLSRSLCRACQRHPETEKIHYLDCLTLFCDEVFASQPGATLMAKASADPKYFADDQLHLSMLGYQVWKSKVEQLLADIIK